MQQNETVLEKLGITNQIVVDWKERGLKIRFPMKARRSFLKSKDGIVFVESADKFVPPLTKKESLLYSQQPDKFKEDFLKNVRFYFKFHTFVYEKSKDIVRLNTSEEKFAATLSLMYLFLSAMDYHYYHFDRYLAYEDYPSTPLGYWWSKLGKIYFKVFKEKVSRTKPSPNFLKVLSRDVQTFNIFKQSLTKKEFQDFTKTLEVIKIFEDAQEEEIKIISGYPAKEDLLLKTGFGIWNIICDLIKKYPKNIQEKNYFQILKLIAGHPIISTRILLLPSSLKYFTENILVEFKKEIDRWIN